MTGGASAGHAGRPGGTPVAVPNREPDVFTRLFRIWRDRGASSLWLKLLYELSLYRCCELHWLRFDVESEEFTAHIPLQCAPLEPEQLDAYLAFRPNQERADIQHRLDAGHLCCAAWHDGRIIAAVWGGGGLMPLPYLHCDLRLSPDVYFGYDNYVLSEFRGYQVIGSVLIMRHRYLRERYPRSIGIVWPENPAAVRRRAKHGHPVFARVGFWGVGPWRRHFLRLDPDTVDPPFAMAPRT